MSEEFRERFKTIIGDLHLNYKQLGAKIGYSGSTIQVMVSRGIPGLDKNVFNAAYDYFMKHHPRPHLVNLLYESYYGTKPEQSVER